MTGNDQDDSQERCSRQDQAKCDVSDGQNNKRDQPTSKLVRIERVIPTAAIHIFVDLMDNAYRVKTSEKTQKQARQPPSSTSSDRIRVNTSAATIQGSQSQPGKSSSGGMIATQMQKKKVTTPTKIQALKIADSTARDNPGETKRIQSPRTGQDLKFARTRKARNKTKKTSPTTYVPSIPWKVSKAAKTRAEEEMEADMDLKSTKRNATPVTEASIRQLFTSIAENLGQNPPRPVHHHSLEPLRKMIVVNPNNDPCNLIPNWPAIPRIGNSSTQRFPEQMCAMLNAFQTKSTGTTTQIDAVSPILQGPRVLGNKTFLKAVPKHVSEELVEAIFRSYVVNRSMSARLFNGSRVPPLGPSGSSGPLSRMEQSNLAPNGSSNMILNKSLSGVAQCGANGTADSRDQGNFSTSGNVRPTGSPPRNNSGTKRSIEAANTASPNAHPCPVSRENDSANRTMCQPSLPKKPKRAQKITPRKSVQSDGAENVKPSTSAPREGPTKNMGNTPAPSPKASTAQMGQARTPPSTTSKQGQFLTQKEQQVTGQHSSISARNEARVTGSFRVDNAAAQPACNAPTDGIQLPLTHLQAQASQVIQFPSGIPQSLQQFFAHAGRQLQIPAQMVTSEAQHILRNEPARGTPQNTPTNFLPQLPMAPTMMGQLPMGPSREGMAVANIAGYPFPPHQFVTNQVPSTQICERMVQNRNPGTRQLAIGQIAVTDVPFRQLAAGNTPIGEIGPVSMTGVGQFPSLGGSMPMLTNQAPQQATISPMLNVPPQAIPMRPGDALHSIPSPGAQLCGSIPPFLTPVVSSPRNSAPKPNAPSENGSANPRKSLKTKRSGDKPTRKYKKRTAPSTPAPRGRKRTRKQTKTNEADNAKSVPQEQEAAARRDGVPETQDVSLTRPTPPVQVEGTATGISPNSIISPGQTPFKPSVNQATREMNHSHGASNVPVTRGPPSQGSGMPNTQAFVPVATAPPNFWTTGGGSLGQTNSLLYQSNIHTVGNVEERHRVAGCGQAPRTSILGASGYTENILPPGVLDSSALTRPEHQIVWNNFAEYDPGTQLSHVNKRDYSQRLYQNGNSGQASNDTSAFEIPISIARNATQNSDRNTPEHSTQRAGPEPARGRQEGLSLNANRILLANTGPAEQINQANVSSDLEPGFSFTEAYIRSHSEEGLRGIAEGQGNGLTPVAAAETDEFGMTDDVDEIMFQCLGDVSPDQLYPEMPPTF